jgi:hypothetical protein
LLAPGAWQLVADRLLETERLVALCRPSSGRRLRGDHGFEETISHQPPAEAIRSVDAAARGPQPRTGVSTRLFYEAFAIDPRKTY